MNKELALEVLDDRIKQLKYNQKETLNRYNLVLPEFNKLILMLIVLKGIIEIGENPRIDTDSFRKDYMSLKSKLEAVPELYRPILFIDDVLGSDVLNAPIETWTNQYNEDPL